MWTGKPILRGLLSPNHVQYSVLFTNNQHGKLVERLKTGAAKTTALGLILLLVPILLSAARGLKPLVFVKACIVFAAAVAVTAALVKLRPFFHRITPRSVFTSAMLLLVIGLTPRLLTVAVVRNDQVSDFLIFHELAQALHHGEGFSYTGPEGFKSDCGLYLNRAPQERPLPTMFRPAGTPLLLSALYFFTGDSINAAKVFYAFMGALIGLCIFGLTWPVGRRFAFVAGLLWEIYPGTWWFSNLLGTEVPFTLALCASVLLLQRGMARSAPRMSRQAILLLSGSGLLAGFSCLVRPQTHQVLCCLAALLIAGKSFRGTFVAALPFVVGCALPLLLWSEYNYNRFGVFNFQTTEVGVALYNRSLYVSPDHETNLEPLKRVMATSTDEIVLEKTGRTIALRRLWLAFSKENPLHIAWKNHHKIWRHDLEGIGWTVQAATGGIGIGHLQRTIPVSAKLFAALAAPTVISYLSLIMLACMAIGKTGILRLRQTPGLLALALNFCLSSVAFCLFQGTNRYHTALLPVLISLATIPLVKKKDPQRDITVETEK